MTYSVYKLTNCITAKSYVGVSHNPALRFKQHCASPDFIGRAIRKYGKENFLLRTLLISDKEYCFNIEPRCIEVFGTRTPAGYNISPGGNRGHDCTGKIHKPETIEKISIAHKGKKRPPFSDEWKAKLRLNLKKAAASRTKKSFEKMVETKRKNNKPLPPISEETRKKLSDAKLGKTPWNKGKRINGLTKKIESW